MQCAAWPFVLALAVQRSRDGEGVRVNFDDAAQSRSRRIDRLDAREILPDQRLRSKTARIRSILKLGDGDFIEFERLDCVARRLACSAGVCCRT
jgi:hypothetical protein